MAQVICFANSFKKSGRCIAGIDLDTKKWVRPIGKGHEGAIGRERLIKGAEPQLLDILDIPIGANADNLGCQPENLLLQSGPWKKTGEITVDDAIQYSEKTKCLLHNCDKKVRHLDFSQRIGETKWKSLQLIHVKAKFSKNQWDRTECSFRYSGNWYTLKAPCPEADEQIGSSGNYLLTISMGGPYRRKTEDELACWKMVAGVIELD